MTDDCPCISLDEKLIIFARTLPLLQPLWTARQYNPGNYPLKVAAPFWRIQEAGVEVSQGGSVHNSLVGF
jgi:hypothetical protein